MLDENSAPPALLTKMVACDGYGKPTDTYAVFSSKGNDNFNHKEEWKIVGLSLSRGKPFNYYPRGRVEIRNRKAFIFLNPDICTEAVIQQVKDCFHLGSPELLSVRVVADGSEHYAYLKE